MGAENYLAKTTPSIEEEGASRRRNTNLQFQKSIVLQHQQAATVFFV
jgi:hypothetical protein